MPQLDQRVATRWQCPNPKCRHIWTLRGAPPPAKCPVCKKRNP